MRAEKRWPLAILLAVLAACSSESEKPEPVALEATPIEAEQQQRWQQYIAAHTGGFVSRKVPIEIRFEADVVTEEQIGAVQNKLVSMTPAVEFDAVFDNQRELWILPKAPLASGQTYQIKLHVDALPSLPQSLGDYSFDIRVYEQTLELTRVNADVDPVRDEHVILRGEFETRDDANDADIRDNVTILLNKQALPVNWVHVESGRRHQFESDAIARSDAEQIVQLNWGGGQFVSPAGEKQLSISPRGRFQVTRAERDLQNPNTIVVHFSEPLARQQSLKGLVQLSRGSFTTRIEQNQLLVQVEQGLFGELKLDIDKAIKAEGGRALVEGFSQKFEFESLKPEVRFVDQGMLLPEAETLFIPFETMNASAVHVYAFRIFDNNLLPYLQHNSLDQHQYLRRYARFLARKTIALDATKPNQWRRFGVDVSDLYRRHPGEMFHFKLLITRGDSLYPCDAAMPSKINKTPPEVRNNDEYRDGDNNWSFADESYGDYLNEHHSYYWAERADPCTEEYFRYSGKTQVARNFLSANIGLLAKAGTDGKLLLTATNIRTGEPMPNTSIKLYSQQVQVITTVKTDGNGLVTVQPDIKPMILIAENGDYKGYLRLSSSSELATSHFDVSGESFRQGVKGTIYGERDVWRPGDTLHLTFVLQDPQNAIPDDHPATLELYNPLNQKVYSDTNLKPVNGFYAFAPSTRDSDITGDWRAVVRLGNRTFERAVKIETVMPNRLKMELSVEGDLLRQSAKQALSLFSQWLHGAKANGLKAEVNARLTGTRTQFEQFKSYQFDDPARTADSQEQKLFEGRLNAEGRTEFTPEIRQQNRAPGMMNLLLTTRVFEPGGAFSIGSQSLKYSPYSHYAGLKLEPSKGYYGYPLNQPIPVQLAAVDEFGQPADERRLELSLYKVEWSWWWENSGNNLARYDSANAPNLVKQMSVTVKNGKADTTFELDDAWQRYLLRVCDSKSGHCAGTTLYSGWNDEASSPAFGAHLLMLSADKKKYSVGETAKLTLPPATKGRALISIENGSSVLSQRWLALDGQRAFIDIPIEANMAPNVYVSVHLIQPQQEKTNDRPIRLFGVTPLLVTDPATVLQPVLTAPDEVRPQTTLNITVAEKQGRPMTYTLAVVDEGLLGLTNFKTPQLHKEFYKREALGIKTWDMFDQVIGAYGGSLEKLLALGGSDEGADGDGKKDQKRFPPVVRFIGPFELAANKSDSHAIELPPYLGSVRVMVVAGQNAAYGSSEKNVLVKQPLMVQATLPRVLGPGESLQMPVSVFAMKEKLGKVQISVEANDLIEVVDGGLAMQFDREGDQLGLLKLKVKDAIGQAKVTVIASAGNERSEQSIDIAVRSHNLPSVVSQSKRLAPGESWQTELKPHGYVGTNELSLEANFGASLNLADRLQYLIQYPHGCVEQTTSGAFPQLYLTQIMNLGEKEQRQIQQNVNAGIDRLKRFQQAGGSFSYWPGDGYVNDWSTSYVGHFLVEAKKRGFSVPESVISRWQQYQRQRAQQHPVAHASDALEQAYRLYTLALSGAPELGAMNRLRDKLHNNTTARFLLAAAYKQAGISDIAQSLIRDHQPIAPKYDYYGPTFGSSLRDQAVLLETVLDLDDQRADDLAESISAAINDNYWYSTQDVAWSLKALSRYNLLGAGQTLSVDWKAKDSKQSLRSEKPVLKMALPGAEQAQQHTIKNTSSAPVRVTLFNRGVAPAGSEQDVHESLRMSIRFTDRDGRSVDISKLTQGTDFLATIDVRNTASRRLEQLALSALMPSGWEILNARLFSSGEGVQESPYEYRDIRDDRVMTYFALNAGESRTYKLWLSATYPGRYYLPAWTTEAMYDAKRVSRIAGRWLEVMAEAEPVVALAAEDVP